MLLKTLLGASFVALVLTGPAVAQDNSTNPLILKKKQQTQENSGQGGNAGQKNAGQKQSQQNGNQSKANQQNAQQSGDQNSGATGNSNNAQAQGKADKKKKIEQSQQGQQAGGSEATGSTSKPAEITTEKRTVIRQKLVTKNVTKVDRSKLNIDINVGVAVPATIQLHPLPTEVIQIVPEYQGYDYFVLADGTIVIVDPGSHQIVLVLSA